MKTQPFNTLQVPIKKEQYIEKDGVIYSLKRIGTQEEIVARYNSLYSKTLQFENNSIDQMTEIEDALKIKIDNKPSKK